MDEQVIPERVCACVCHEEGQPWCDLCFNVFPRHEDGSSTVRALLLANRYMHRISELEAKVAEFQNALAHEEMERDIARAKVAEQEATIERLTAAIKKMEKPLRWIADRECANEEECAELASAALNKQEHP
jgi:uncharacterized coiled-coil protein SlyX